MGRFIPIDKMKKLREAAKNGDERARKIIAMQLAGKDDFSADLDDYFNPHQPQQTMSTQASGVQQKPAMPKHKDCNPNLLKFLGDNGVAEDSADYDGYVKDFYNEFPNEKPQIGQMEQKGPDCDVFDRLIEDEIEAVTGYQQALLEIINDDSIGEATKKGIIADLEEIKRDEIEHLEKLKRLKSSKCEKKEAKQALNFKKI